MQSILRHPHYPGALTKNELVPWLPIKWFGTVDGAQFAKTGELRSYPYEDSHGETLIRVSFSPEFEPEGIEMSLITLGVLPNSEGVWSDCVTISTENDMAD